MKYYIPLLLLPIAAYSMQSDEELPALDTGTINTPQNPHVIDTATIDTLTKSGIDLNATNDAGENFLYTIIRENTIANHQDPSPVIKYACDRGANIRHTKNDNNTILHYIAHNNATCATPTACAYGAPLNQENDLGPPIQASTDVDYLSYILAYGAQWNNAIDIYPCEKILKHAYRGSLKHTLHQTIAWLRYVLWRAEDISTAL